IDLFQTNPPCTKRLAPVAVAAISNGITIGDAPPPVPTSATIIQSLKTSSYHERELWKHFII
ncbi:hypothetical protein, partial [Bacillus cereus]|uniref:hypothetical protein n=1 Tax=Bacillus cereus TaxID=1396 RepID=UPI003016AF27